MIGRVAVVAALILAALPADAGALEPFVDPPPINAPRAVRHATTCDSNCYVADLLSSTRLILPSYQWTGVGESSDFLRNVTLTNLPIGSSIVRYEGPYKPAASKLQGRLRKLWRDSLRDQWEAGVLDDENYDDALLAMSDATEDHRRGGRWWERAWYHSLTPARGGAPTEPFIERVGSRIDVIRVGPIALTNELRLTFDRVLSIRVVDPGQIFRDVELRSSAVEYARLRRVDSDDEVQLPTNLPPNETNLGRIDIATEAAPSERWWRFRAQPAASVALGSDVTRIVREVSLRATLEIFIGARRLRCVELRGSISYRPLDQVGIVEVTAALLTW